MYAIKKQFKFEASHRLPRHGGKCRRLHGHSFRLTVMCRSEELQKFGSSRGMVMDFGDIKAAVAPVLEKLDHHDLNQSTGLTDPTSENLARWCFERLKRRLPTLSCIGIAETDTAEAFYWE
jgi:6-pyruvoyltetrahydropterin/6-carboxytetrahydropterin synthase